MKQITREQYESEGRNRGGGDFWNPWKVAAVAFRRFPSGKVVAWDYVGTGLWVDVRVDGAPYTRIYS